MTDETTPKKKTVKKQGTASTTADGAVAAVLDELRQDRASRDQQLDSLVQEIREGFEQYGERGVKRDREFEQLIASLGNAFTKLELATSQRDNRHDEVMARLSDSIILEHKTIHEEVLEQEKLQDKKLQHFKQVQSEQARKTRLLAIPGMIIALLALVYMFYTVHVMEVAMTSMSHDMDNIKVAIENMSTDTKVMTANTGQMTRDINILTHNVAPAMTGMRQMMPWGP